jgi:hypothetical protein
VVDAAVVVIEPVASRISVANAPCTYEAFEITLDDPNVPGALDVLDMVAAAGYSRWSSNGTPCRNPPGSSNARSLTTWPIATSSGSGASEVD